jgi:hypothetical protein
MQSMHLFIRLELILLLCDLFSIVIIHDIQYQTNSKEKKRHDYNQQNVKTSRAQNQKKKKKKATFYSDLQGNYKILSKTRVQKSLYLFLAFFFYSSQNFLNLYFYFLKLIHFFISSNLQMK